MATPAAIQTHFRMLDDVPVILYTFRNRLETHHAFLVDVNSKSLDISYMEGAGFERIPTHDARWMLVMDVFQPRLPHDVAATMTTPTLYYHPTYTTVSKLETTLADCRTGFRQPVSPPAPVPVGATATKVTAPTCTVKRCTQVVVTRQQEALWKQHRANNIPIRYCPEHWLQRIHPCHQCERIHVRDHATPVWKYRRLGATIRYLYACDAHLPPGRVCPHGTPEKRCARIDVVEEDETYRPICPTHDLSAKRPRPGSVESSPKRARTVVSPTLLPPSPNNDDTSLKPSSEDDSDDEDYVDGQDDSEDPEDNEDPEDPDEGDPGDNNDTSSALVMEDENEEEEEDSGVSQDYRGQEEYSSDNVDEEKSATETEGSE